MAVIKFTAVDRGELPSWLANGATFYLANNFQGFPRDLIPKGQVEETHDGTPEGYLHALQREYSIVTDFIPIHERPVWRAFFTSVLNVESFQIDFSARQLLGNPGFEAGSTSPWINSGAGAFAINSDAGLQALGQYAGRVTLAVSGTSNLFESPSAAAVPDQTWLLQGLAKRDETSLPNRNVQLYLRFGDSGDVTFGQSGGFTASSSTSGYQLQAGTVTTPASTAFVRLRWSKVVPNGTDETGRWLFDEHLLALLSAWEDVYLVDRRINEQQLGGVGVQYRFRVRTLP